MTSLDFYLTNRPEGIKIYSTKKVQVSIIYKYNIHSTQVQSGMACGIPRELCERSNIRHTDMTQEPVYHVYDLT